MATIGSFKKSGNEFQGEIVTLSVQAKGVRIVPETNRTSDNAPSHRVFVGRAEIGAAWSKRSSEGRDYLSVKLDDPRFNTPIYANLFVIGQRLAAIAVGNPPAGVQYLGGTRRETADHHLIAIGEPGEPVAPAIGTGVKTYMKR